MYHLMAILFSVAMTALILSIMIRTADRQLNDPVTRKKIFDRLGRKYGS